MADDSRRESVHPHKCPVCETTIRATNIENLFDDGDCGAIVPGNLSPFSEYSVGDHDHQQLHYCPNDECRIVRLLPGESNE